jgi:hypothetical protein
VCRRAHCTTSHEIRDVQQFYDHITGTD